MICTRWVLAHVGGKLAWLPRASLSLAYNLSMDDVVEERFREMRVGRSYVGLQPLAA